MTELDVQGRLEDDAELFDLERGAALSYQCFTGILEPTSGVSPVVTHTTRLEEYEVFDDL